MDKERGRAGSARKVTADGPMSKVWAGAIAPAIGAGWGIARTIDNTGGRLDKRVRETNSVVCVCEGVKRCLRGGWVAIAVAI
jgi:hypothetical protein